MTIAISKISNRCPACDKLNGNTAKICYNCGFNFIESEKLCYYRKILEEDAGRITGEQMKELVNKVDKLYKKLRELNIKDPEMFSDWGRRIYILIKLFIYGMKEENPELSADFLHSIAVVLRGFLRARNFIYNLVPFGNYEEDILMVSILWFDRKDEIEKYVSMQEQNRLESPSQVLI